MKKLAWALLIVVTALYGLRSWEWGMMDDLSFHGRLVAHVNQYGLFMGILRDMVDLLDLDLHYWGFFRYSYAVYSALLYLVPPNVAYLSRLLEFYFLLWISWKMVKGAAKDVWIPAFALTAILAIRCLHDGLSIVNLCEFTGDLFVASGMAILMKPAKSRWDHLWILGCLLVAVGFKPPFVWTLFAYGLFLLDRRRMAKAAVTLCFFVALLIIAFYLSRHGTYSQDIYQFDPRRFVSTLVRFGVHFSPAAFVFAALFTVYSIDRAALSRQLRERSDIFWAGGVLLLGGLGYLATLLPRGVAQGLGMYLAAPIYMIVQGAFLLLAPVLVARRGPLSTFRPWAMAAATAVAVLITGYSLSRTLARDRTVRELRDWLIANGEGKTFAINSRELSSAMPAVVSNKLGRPWPPMTSLTSSDPLPAAVEYYIVFDEQAPPRADAEGSLVARFPLASVFLLLNPVVH